MDEPHHMFAWHAIAEDGSVYTAPDRDTAMKDNLSCVMLDALLNLYAYRIDGWDSMYGV